VAKPGPKWVATSEMPGPERLFRSLRDISVEIRVDLMMSTSSMAHFVDEIEIASPLRGHVPQGFIVGASIASGQPGATSKTQSTVTSAVKDQNYKESTKWIHHN
jgi:hypothetical protein